MLLSTRAGPLLSRTEQRKSRHPLFFRSVVLLVISLLMMYKHLSMVHRHRSCFWSGVFNLSLIIFTPGCLLIASPLMLLRLNSSGLVPLSSSVDLILFSSLKSSHSLPSRQVCGIWVLLLIVHLPLLSTSLISHVPPIFT